MLQKMLTLTILIILICGCTKDSEDLYVQSDQQSPAPYSVKEEKQTESCCAAKTVTVQFSIDQNTTSFQVITKASQQPIRIVHVTGPNGDIIFDRTKAGDIAMSNAGEFQNQVNTFSYPIFSNLETVSAGNYSITYELSNPEDPAVLESTILTKHDPNLTQGILNINLVYAGPISTAYASKIAIEDALEFTRAIFRKANVDLRITEYNVPEAPALMPNPTSGDPIYEEFAKITGPGINLYMAADVANLKVANYSSGITGSNPGPFIPTTRSAVVISINKASGSDGLFNGGRDIDEHYQQDYGKDPKVFDETRVMAETITKELLRYLGLAHSVEFQGNTISRSDIVDSPKCNSKKDCFNDRLARHNIMFPEPATGRKYEHGRNDLILYPRVDLSQGQTMMINRAIGVQ